MIAGMQFYCIAGTARYGLHINLNPFSWRVGFYNGVGPAYGGNAACLMFGPVFFTAEKNVP